MNGAQGLDGVGATAHHLDIRVLAQQHLDLVAGVGFVVDDQGPDHAAASWRGRRIDTRVHSPARHSTVSPNPSP